MYLKTVTLKNWRSYRAARFDFPPPRPFKKVILVGAMNGHGKTSLLIALHLGLFGREAMQFIEGYRFDGGENIRSYKQLLSRIIHRPALDEDDPQVIVDLEFVGPDEESICVTRTWNFRRGGQVRELDGGDGEEVRITVGDKWLKNQDWKHAGELIASRLLPLHVMPCFFFDGEQAQARVEAAGNRAMDDAISAIYGASVVSTLDDSLASYANNQRQKLRSDVGEVEETELDRKREERAQLEAKLKTLRARKDELAREIADADRARRAKLFELQQNGADRVIDLEQLGRKMIDLEGQARELRTKLTETLAAAALPLAMRRHAATVERQLEQEIVRDRWEVLKQEAVPKADRIVKDALPKPEDRDVDPALTPGQREALEKRLRTALTTLWSPPPDNCASAYEFVFLSPSERDATLAALHGARATGGADMAALAAEWQSVQLRLKDAKKQWAANSDLRPRNEQLRKEYEQANERYQTQANDRAAVEANERGVQAQLNDLVASIAQMEQRQSKREPAEQKLDVVDRVRAVISETQERLAPLCRKAVAEACSRHFAQMISDEYRNYTVEFDDDHQPMLKGPNGVPVPVGGMSGAQKRAFGLAFTLAIAEASGEESPIIIDTPVGNMDSAYRARVLKHLAKTAPGQVIFLSHDEEISREYARELATYVAEKYLVDFTPVGEGAGVSTVFRGQYFSR